MEIFENLRPIVERVLEGNSWIRWVHEGTKPAYTIAEKQEYVNMNKTNSHCATCLNLNGCHFPENNMPDQPVHPNCHCIKKYINEPIPNKTAFAKCPIEKFTHWAFANDAKKRFFEINGYDIMDSESLKEEYERQAVQKYAEGNFVLGKLDGYGQRITIHLELVRRYGWTKDPFTLNSGWLVYPDGKIQLTTPATDLSRHRA